MTEIRAIPYKESRLEHFKALRERRRKTLHWWKYQKPYKQYDAQTIQEMCSELGREIGYLDDVIEMLEKVGDEPEKLKEAISKLPPLPESAGSEPAKVPE